MLELPEVVEWEVDEMLFLQFLGLSVDGCCVIAGQEVYGIRLIALE